MTLIGSRGPSVNKNSVVTSNTAAILVIFSADGLRIFLVLQLPYIAFAGVSLLSQLLQTEFFYLRNIRILFLRADDMVIFPMCAHSLNKFPFCRTK